MYYGPRYGPPPPPAYGYGYGYHRGPPPPHHYHHCGPRVHYRAGCNVF